MDLLAAVTVTSAFFTLSSPGPTRTPPLDLASRIEHLVKRPVQVIA